MCAQPLCNILRNAVEAIGEDGGITIRLGTQGTHASVAIEDTGRGIDPEVKDQLFNRFFSTKEKGQGIEAQPTPLNPRLPRPRRGASALPKKKLNSPLDIVP